MEIRVKDRATLIALGLVFLGVVARLLPHPANVAPVGAIALFGGTMLGKRIGWWLPVLIMAVSDLFLGFYNSMPFTWFGFLLVGLLGLSFKSWHSWVRVPVGALAGASIFFLVSNFGVWLVGGLYPHTWAGLGSCYTLAVPFFRATIIGDMLYATAFFGLYNLATRTVNAQAKQPSDIAA